MSEDWHLYIKIAARGLKVAIIPEALYFYRIRPDSRYRTGDHGVNHVRVLPDVAAIDFTQAERVEVWTLLASLVHAGAGAEDRYTAAVRECEALKEQIGAWRYRALDSVVSAVQALNPVAILRRLARLVNRARRRVWGRLARSAVSARR
jgi:hypothetical protein